MLVGLFIFRPSKFVFFFGNIFIEYFLFIMVSPEAYSEPCQTSKMEIFRKIVNASQPLTISPKFSIFRPEYLLRTAGNVRQKIELCPKKAASQRTQLFGVKLRKIISYRCLKTQKHLVSIGLSCSGSSFMNILIDNLLLQFFIFKIVGCVCVKRF